MIQPTTCPLGLDLIHCQNCYWWKEQGCAYQSIDIEWDHAQCPVCGLSYPFIKGSYKPKTYGNFNCVHKFLHPEIRKEVMPIGQDNNKKQTARAKTN